MYNTCENRSMSTPVNGSSVEDLIRGMNDVPLDARGIQQAQHLAQRIRAKGGVDRVISSSLKRARKSGEIIVGAVPGSRFSYATDLLTPWHLGQYEGQPSEKAHEEIKVYVKNPNRIVPGKGKDSGVPGESFKEFVTRYFGFLKFLDSKIDHEIERVLAMTHYRNIKAALSAEDLADKTVDPDMMTKWPDNIDTSSLYSVKIAGDKLVVKPIDIIKNDVLPMGLILGRHGKTALNQ